MSHSKRRINKIFPLLPYPLLEAKDRLRKLDVLDKKKTIAQVGKRLTTAFDVIDNLELRYTSTDECTMHVDVKRMRA